MKTRIFSLALMLGMSLGLFSQSAYQPTQENLKARQEFQDNKFGIFLHWGLYSMLATGEWTWKNKREQIKNAAGRGQRFLMFYD